MWADPHACFSTHLCSCRYYRSSLALNNIVYMLTDPFFSRLLHKVQCTCNKPEVKSIRLSGACQFRRKRVNTQDNNFLFSFRLSVVNLHWLIDKSRSLTVPQFCFTLACMVRQWRIPGCNIVLLFIVASFLEKSKAVSSKFQVHLQGKLWRCSETDFSAKQICQDA